MSSNLRFEIRRNLIFLGLFSIAMGALESIVVVYLRQIYYPQGFDFPLTLLSPQMISVEWLREVSTLIMLAAVGIIAGKNNMQKFSYFLYSFAIWDIFYYIWLKLLLNWPSSFFTWDILFLIPVPWIGPVLAPVICSLTMILLSGILIYLQEKGYTVKLKLYEWGLIFLGVFMILSTFIWDYTKILIQHGLISRFWSLTEDVHSWEIISHYNPTHYNWYLFLSGEILVLFSILLLFKRIKSK